MAGIMIATKTEYGTVMLYLINEGKIMDRFEVCELLFSDSDEIEFLTKEQLLKLEESV
jgi:hypothetical protein